MAEIKPIIENLRRLNAQIMSIHQQLVECRERVSFKVKSLKGQLARIIPDGMSTKDKYLLTYDREFETVAIANTQNGKGFIFSFHADCSNKSDTFLNDEDEISTSFANLAIGPGNGKQAVFAAVEQMLIGYEAKIVSADTPQI